MLYVNLFDGVVSDKLLEVEVSDKVVLDKLSGRYFCE